MDANIFPSDVSRDMDGPTFTKIGFNYTGPDSLAHDQESELVENVLRKSKDLFLFLPALGVSTVLPKVTTELTLGTTLNIVC